MTQPRNFLPSLACAALLAASLVLPLRPAFAAPHSITAGEVLSLVNALRSSRGLQPYSIDPGISAYAQEHSEYQALTDTSTHLHSDGQVSLAHGMVENVAGGDNNYLTAEAVVYEIWSDPVHMKPMVGYESGSAGVGVASNATTTFVTLNVRPGDVAVGPARTGGTPGSSLLTTPIALVPLRTATMKPSGAVVHEVGYGQSLWAIAVAYGVTGARIRELNGMAPDDSQIWAGQWLLIVPAGLVTPTPPPAETAAPTVAGSTPVTMAVAPSPVPTRTPTQAASAFTAPPSSRLAGQIKMDPVLAGLIGLIFLGMGLFLISSVRINRRS